MKHQFELTDELDEQTPPDLRWLDFKQEVERVAKKLKITKTEIARRFEVSRQQLNRLMSEKDGKRVKILPLKNVYFLALRAIEFEKEIRQARVIEERDASTNETY